MQWDRFKVQLSNRTIQKQNGLEKHLRPFPSLRFNDLYTCPHMCNWTYQPPKQICTQQIQLKNIIYTNNTQTRYYYFGNEKHEQ